MCIDERVTIIKHIIIILRDSSNCEELLKNIGFISEDIMNFYLDGTRLHVDTIDTCDVENLKKEILAYESQLVSVQSEASIFSFNDDKRKYFDDVYHNCEIHSFGQGNLAMSGVAEFLFRFFDEKFEHIALRHNAYRKIYPALLPMDAYQKTGYLKRSPQYAIFCCNTFEDFHKLERLNSYIRNGNVSDMLKEPQFALSPSACFHTYLEYENQNLCQNSLFTFCQNVFRNEGRFNFTEIGRLMDYHVREMVMIGSDDYVACLRHQIMNEVIELLKNWKLCCEIVVASDPFIMPKAQKLKKIQCAEKTKYELRINCSSTHKISVASFNLHEHAFTQTFGIRVDEQESTVTGCIGFGIERWVVAFLSQFGSKPESWPEEIYNAYRKRG